MLEMPENVLGGLDFAEMMEGAKGRSRRFASTVRLALLRLRVEARRESILAVSLLLSIVPDTGFAGFLVSGVSEDEGLKRSSTGTSISERVSPANVSWNV